MADWGKYVVYDETSPSYLRWRHDRGRSRVVKAGDVAGTLDKQGRWSFVLSSDGDKKRRYNHRVIYEMFNGPLAPTFEVDHEDGNPANNKISNLRAATRKLNGRNVKRNPRNVTGENGVAKAVINGCTYYIATYVTLEGKRKLKHFSVKALGEKQAFDLAVSHRREAQAALNEEGAGYTERHGT